MWIDRDRWRERARLHRQRADALLADHLARRMHNIRHPIEDFLFTYYSVKPSQLRRWTPGVGVILESATRFDPQPTPGDKCTDDAEFARLRDTDLVRDRYIHEVKEHGRYGLTIDLARFFDRRGSTLDYVENLLRKTMEHPPQFGCFGLHEWAMVYHLSPEQLRHRGLRLRIGHEASDRVVESHRIGCTHFDAFRFFTADAAPLNTIQPTRETQPQLEQSGCLHAGMDIYKWIGKLAPIIPSELVLESFELAREIRIVDMQASPYDVSDYGYAAIPIETAQGKREYAQRQREFATRGNRLRRRVLAEIERARMLFHRAGGSSDTGERRTQHHSRSGTIEKNALLTPSQQA